MIDRITYRITDETPAHIRFSLWVNGGLVCSPGGICLRVDEFAPFIEKLGAVSDSEWYNSLDQIKGIVFYQKRCYSQYMKQIKVNYIATGEWASYGNPFYLECQHSDYEEDGQRLYCDHCDKMGYRYEETEYEGTDDDGNVETSTHTLIEWFE